MKQTKTAKTLRRQRRRERRRLNSLLHRSVSTAADALSYRSTSFSSIDEQQRTVMATLSTEQPVAMYDYRSRGVIDEVLLASGGRFAERLPMLDNHSRWGSTSVFGSIRDIRNDGDRWRGTLHFATDAGEEVDRAWQLVRQGHLTDVSVGYRYGESDFIDIPSGRSETIDGRTFTAGVRTMRVVRNWTAKEVSLTPIGADDQAKIGRGSSENPAGGTAEAEAVNFSYALSDGDGVRHMNTTAAPSATGKAMKQYLKWLHARGMSESITEQAAALEWASRNLAGDLLGEFVTVCRTDGITFEPAGQTATTPPPAPTVSGSTVRQEPPTQTATIPMQSAEQIRAESERIRYIQQQSDGVDEAVVQRAIDEGWDTRRINSEFRQAAQQRQEPVGHAPAIHTTNNTLDGRTLQAAMLARAGVDISSPMFRSAQAQHVLGDRSLFRGGDGRGRAQTDNGEWLVSYARSLDHGGPTTDESAARAIDRSHRYSNMSLLDVCREACNIEGVSYDRYDHDDIISRAFSTATLNAVFTTNFAAQMLAGFMDYPDSTLGWTAEADLPNFQTVERIQMHKMSKLKRTDKNQTPGDAEAEAVLESYKLVRYAERFVVDEMDIIDDRFGALDVQAPRDLGEAARVLRPDLVYSILLGNPTMGQDSTALFATDHSNLTASGAGLSLSSIAAARAAMASQTSNGRLLDIRGQYIIVPETKLHTLLTILGSSEIRNTTASTEYGTMNWAKGLFQPVADPRLDAGVTDPATGTAHAGQAGSWFMATAGGKHAIEVGHLRGTGRAPVVRRFNLTEGRIGVGWLVIMYCAAKAVGYQGIRKSAA